MNLPSNFVRTGSALFLKTGRRTEQLVREANPIHLDCSMGGNLGFLLWFRSLEDYELDRR